MERTRSYDELEEPEGQRPFKHQRKQRACLSCAECRRLKMKCDRQVPCGSCVRRNRVRFCVPARDTGCRQDESTQYHQCSDSCHAHGCVHTSSADISQKDYPSLPVESLDGQTQSIDRLAVLADILDQSPRLSSTRDSHQSIPNGAPTTDGSSTHNAPEDGDQDGPSGTLTLSRWGGSKYLGPTAGSEWLHETEMQDTTDSPLLTRAPSPELPSHPPSTQLRNPSIGSTPISFPFSNASATVSTRDLLACLPDRDEAWELAECYYRYCAWHHDVAPKTSFQATFDRVYSSARRVPGAPHVSPQEIALVFIVMAHGTAFNIEMPHCDPSAEQWLHLAEQALVKGNFLKNNMLSDLQTLHLMAHLHLQIDKDQNGDKAWPLWGLLMRLIQAMGMHRDGARWRLPHDVAEERRKVFWECNAADIFQAHCFSRPSAFNPEYCDTEFPHEPPSENGEKPYSILRFELSQHSAEILNLALKIRKPPYSDVMQVHAKLCEFEQSVPFSLRCRAALMFMPSRYPRVDMAIEASPEPSRRSLVKSFRQTNLALNISETVINLHRPYYAKALHDVGRVTSLYISSFYTVIERCALIIAIVGDIHSRFPAVSTRQWNFWHHVFNSALCLGMLVLRDPTNAMADFVMTQIDAAIGLFTSLLQHGAHTPRYRRNLQLLLSLRTKMVSKMSTAKTTQGSHDDTSLSDEAGNPKAEQGDREHSEEDVELLGWRTRLVDRAGHSRQTTIHTIHGSKPAMAPSQASVGSQEANNPAKDPYLGQGGATGQMGLTTVNSTSDMIHEFWDPMLLQDFFDNPSDPADPMSVSRTSWWDDLMNEVQR